MFGWKFWSFIVGAAPLPADLEAFFSELGFLVIQGYGLTETAPIVTLNHPFHARQGSVGKPIAGVEVKIAADGEILVRGENVTSGYFQHPEETARAFEDGWFHTGDIGELKENGELTILGRKKEMIVTPEGLNVFPGRRGERAEAAARRARRGGDRDGSRARGADSRTRRRAAEDRAPRQRAPGRLSAGAQLFDLALRRISAHGRNRQAEAPRDRQGSASARADRPIWTCRSKT